MSNEAPKTKRRISLKYKLLVLLVSLPVLALSLYLVLATQLFKSDKIAYVFDTTAMAARSLSSRVRLEFAIETQALGRIMRSFDLSLNRFSSAAEGQLKEEKNLLGLQVYRVTAGHPSTKVTSWLSEESRTDNPIEGFEDESATQSLIQKSLVDGLAVEGVPKSSDVLKLAMPWGKAGNQKITHVVVTWTKFEDLGGLFGKAGSYTPFLIGPNGILVLAPVTGTKDLGVKKDYFSEIPKRKHPEGTEETRSEKGTDLLASFSKVGLGQLSALTFVKKEEALHAIDLLFWKSILFFVALISFSVILSVFASGKLTTALLSLYSATQKVSSGDFTVKVDVDSNDEVGSLAESFNKMAGEISRLMAETADKARMEKELETAKTVQETLFPESSFLINDFQLSGYYHPASECGGDWWYHCMIQGKIFLWIGDATGHGAPAALITSAARSAASVIENLPDISPGRAMRFLNSAINRTSKGKMMMTFFIASLDPATGEFSYSNASHDPPFLLRNTGQKLTKKDIEPLNEINNPRLGQEADFDFSEVNMKLGPGDSLIFYTDGVPDVKNPNSEPWGQKNFFKAILGAISEDKPVQEKVAAIRDQVESYRGGAELPDDVTFFVCQYGQK